MICCKKVDVWALALTPSPPHPLLRTARGAKQGEVDAVGVALEKACVLVRILMRTKT